MVRSFLCGLAWCATCWGEGRSQRRGGASSSLIGLHGRTGTDQLIISKQEPANWRPQKWTGHCSDGVDLLTPKIRWLRGEMRPDLGGLMWARWSSRCEHWYVFVLIFGDGFDVVNKTARDRINGVVRTRFRTSRVHFSWNQDKVISWFTSLPSLLATSPLPLFLFTF